MKKVVIFSASAALDHIFKMAEEMYNRVECALKTIESSVEIGGYMKKDTKENVIMAVSDIRNCILKLRSALDSKTEKTINHTVIEVIERETAGGEREDSRLVGQLVTSVDQSDHHGSESQRLAASEAQTANPPPEPRAQSTAVGGDRNGTPDEYQRPETPTDQAGKENSDVEIQERIVGKITHKIQSMMECIKQLVKEEIAIETQKKRQPWRTPIEIPDPSNTSEENTNNRTSESAINDEEGYSRVQTRRQRTRRNSGRINNQDSNHQLRPARQKSPPPPKRGRGPNTGGRLRPAMRLAWIYVGHLDEGTKEQDIIDDMAEKGFDRVKECTAIRTSGRNKAFKLAVPEEDKDIVDNEKFWPEGVNFRPFQF